MTDDNIDAIQILFVLSTTCVRMSLILFIRRLYASVSDRMNLLCNVLFAINVMFGIGAILAVALECEPANAAFDVFKFVKASCHQRAILWTVMILHVLLDWSTVILPLGLVWHMNVISTRKRIEAGLVFGCGLVYVLESSFHND